DLPWEKILFTFGDERCVPPENNESNFRMANEALFRPASVPDSSILRMRGELEPAVAAKEYQAQLDALATKRGEKIFEHDLILLGLGDDGHTASLFPETEALSETHRRVMANYVSKMKLAMQILGERPHPNLLPRGEGTTSPPSLPRGERRTRQCQ